MSRNEVFRLLVALAVGSWLLFAGMFVLNRFFGVNTFNQAPKNNSIQNNDRLLGQIENAGTHQQYLPLIYKKYPLNEKRYLPAAFNQYQAPTPIFTATPVATSTPTPFPSPLPPPTPFSGIPPLNFTAIRQQLQAQGQDLAFNKLGFHTGAGGNANGIGDFMTQLDNAGIPFFIKAVDDVGPLFEAQQIVKNSAVPHTLVFRRSGQALDVPDYNLSPAAAAQKHWDLHKAALPPEIDPSLVWIETINEVDKNRSEWLADFAYETAQLALADGSRWAAFGWSTGEPERFHWEGPKMLRFLRLVAQHPDQLAIALHEYSLTNSTIAHGYPFKVGRFQELFDVCDKNQIARPTILITEWGWEFDSVPDPVTAMAHIAWSAKLYAAYPQQVRGAAIWYLGGGFGGIASQAQALIAPLRDYSLSHYFSYTPGIGQIDESLFLPLPLQNNFGENAGTPIPMQQKRPRVWPDDEK